MPDCATDHPGRRHIPRRASCPAAVIALVAAVLAAASAAAQLDVVPPTFELNFSNPGARSMGFGGAFAALADDATAAFANPAGLIQLAEPEVSIEGRSWGYSTPYVAGGRIFGEPFGIGLDASDGVRMGRSSEGLSGLSFLSVVYPKDRWSIAFYRHQLASFEFHGELQGLYSGPWPGVASIRREFDHRQIVDLEIMSHAVAGAYRVTEALSVGAGLAYFDGTLSAVTEAYGFACGGPDAPCPPDFLSSFFAERPLVPERLWASNHLTIDDTDWAFNAGLLWSFSKHWKLGGFYRQGPELDVEFEIRTGPAFPLAPTRIVAPGGQAEFPDVFGLGISYRTSGERLTLSCEWDRVRYASLTVRVGEDRLVLEDGDELHLGAEVVFLERTPIAALRLGVWRDPAHRYSHEGVDYKLRAVFPTGDEELHYAVGLGVAFQKMQIDLGVDLSDPLDTVSLSTVYGF